MEGWIGAVAAVAAAIVATVAAILAQRYWTLGGPQLSVGVEFGLRPGTTFVDEIDIEVINRGRTGTEIKRADLQWPARTPGTRLLGIGLSGYALPSSVKLPAEAKAKGSLGLHYDLRGVAQAIKDHAIPLPPRVQVAVWLATEEPELRSGWFDFPEVDPTPVVVSHGPVGPKIRPKMRPKP